MAWFLLGLALLAVVLLSIRALAGADPRQLWQAGRTLLIAVGVIAAVLLMISGRAGWLMALGPLLLLLWRRHGGLPGWSGGGFGARPGRTSQVRSHFLDMTLDHDTGEVDGVVRDGPHAGARLGELPLPVLLQLRRLVASDPQSLLLLEAFLDRRHADWRAGESDCGPTPGPAGADEANGAAPIPPAAMSREEALRVLGLAEGAGEADVHAAHRRLIALVHPDRGGSPFLAAVVNQARDVLIRR